MKELKGRRRKGKQKGKEREREKTPSRKSVSPLIFFFPFFVGQVYVANAYDGSSLRLNRIDVCP